MAPGNPFGPVVALEGRGRSYWERSVKARFADDLGALMEKHNVSRSNLAELIGSSKPYITKVLSGETNLTIETMVKVLLAFDQVPRIEIVPRGQFWPAAFYTIPSQPRDPYRKSRVENTSVSVASEEIEGDVQEICA